MNFFIALVLGMLLGQVLISSGAVTTFCAPYVQVPR